MEPIRTWTTTDGETLEARWDRSDESNPNVIRLVSFGELYTIELPNLSWQDQQYILQARQRNTSKFCKVSAAESQSRSLRAGDRMVKTLDGLEFAFRWCPAGGFMMGSPKEEIGRRRDETQHPVTLTKGFWMLETTVTQEMWRYVMERDSVNKQDRRSSFYSGVNYPINHVNWDECQEFCRRLSSKIGMNVTLPTEAQWEYACRAGTETPFAGDVQDMGWFCPSALTYCSVVLIAMLPVLLYVFADVAFFVFAVPGLVFFVIFFAFAMKGIHSVGQKRPNAWGLYDMHGNVWEWCQDWYGTYPQDFATDPTGPASGLYRVIRGGCGHGEVKHCRSARRGRLKNTGATFRNIGFRLVVSEMAPFRGRNESLR